MSSQPVQSGTPSSRQQLNDEEWRNWMIFHQWKRTHIWNERKFIAWIQASLTLVSPGFIVERIEIFLMRGNTNERAAETAVSSIVPIIPPLLFVLGGLVAVIGTWEFFSDRRRIHHGDMSVSPLLDALILATVVIVVIASILLLGPRP